MLNIVVCMKQVPDPETPASSFAIDAATRRAVPAQGVPPVLSPFDENALEAALRIKDAQPARVTVLSMGPKFAKPVMRKTLALGVDDVLLLEDAIFESFDSYFTAFVLAKAIRKLGKCDMVLCGREAADSDSGQVGIGLAEILAMPALTLARKVDVRDGSVRVERSLPDGYEVLEAPLPAVVTATSEIGELRTPTVTELILAQQKPVTVWDSKALGNPWPPKRTTIVDLRVPSRDGAVEVVSGDTQEQAGENLALKLKELGVF